MCFQRIQKCMKRATVVGQRLEQGKGRISPPWNHFHNFSMCLQAKLTNHTILIQESCRSWSSSHSSKNFLRRLFCVPLLPLWQLVVNVRRCGLLQGYHRIYTFLVDMLSVLPSSVEVKHIFIVDFSVSSLSLRCFC